jgi:hypothetical protein
MAIALIMEVVMGFIIVPCQLSGFVDGAFISYSMNLREKATISKKLGQIRQKCQRGFLNNTFH